ncbi:MAG TPA: DinB family protein [Dehalococcoidia bacterium]|nr:DinB family protein [Dehalococcoidia bacterium]
MDVKTTLKEQMQALHGTLETAIGDCPADALAQKLPGSTINSIGAIYAHTIFGEDGLLNGLVRGGTPVYFAGGWASKVGLDMPQGGMEPDWSVTLDLNLYRQYAAAVYKATDEYLETVSDAELDRVVDPGFAPPMPVRSFIANLLAWHVATHQGEISALKGVQGFNGLDLTH